MQPSPADRLDASTSALLNLPQPFSTIERQVRRGIARLDGHTLLKPLGFGLSAVISLINYLLLLAVLPYFVYRLWEVAGSATVVAFVSSEITRSYPSIRQLSIVQLGKWLFGPSFIEQRHFDSTISDVCSSLERYTRKDRQLKHRKDHWLAHLRATYSVDTQDAVICQMEAFAAALTAVSKLSQAKRDHMASNLEQRSRVELERAATWTWLRTEERKDSIRLAVILHHAVVWLGNLAVYRTEQMYTCLKMRYLILQLACVIRLLLLFRQNPLVDGFVDNLLVNQARQSNASVYADQDANFPDGAAAHVTELTETVLNSLSAIASTPATLSHPYDSLPRVCEAYIAFYKAQQDAAKAEQALFDSILAAILARKDFKRTVAEWRSASGS